jgi:ankyrin repeat protein
MINETINSIQYACQYGSTALVKLLLNNKTIEPSKELDWSIIRASTNGHHNIVKLLLNDERINPTVEKNQAIINAFKGRYRKTVKLLWDDTRVKNTLKKDYIDLYNELVKNDIKNKVKEF